MKADGRTGKERDEVDLSSWAHFPMSVSESKGKTDQPGEKCRRKEKAIEPGWRMADDEEPTKETKAVHAFIALIHSLGQQNIYWAPTMGRSWAPRVKRGTDPAFWGTW